MLSFLISADMTSMVNIFIQHIGQNVGQELLAMKPTQSIYGMAFALTPLPMETAKL